MKILPAICLTVLAMAFPVHLFAGPLRVGHLVDLSGVGAMQGVQTEFGIQLAAKEIKAGGGLIEIFSSDHQMKIGQAVTEANKMLTLNQVDMIISDNAAPSLATVGLADEAERLFLSLSASEDVVKEHRVSFRSCLDYRAGCSLLASYFRKTGERVGFLGVLAEFSDLCLAGFKTQIPDTVVERFNTGEDIRAHILRFKAQQVKHVIVMGFEQDVIAAIKRANEVDLEATFGMPTLYMTPLVISTLAEKLKGTVVFGFQPLEPEFLSKVKSVDPKRDLRNIEFAALAYMHTYQLYQAAQKCPDRSLPCLMDNLAKTTTPNLLGFKGWKERFADFTLTISEWDGKGFKALEGQ